MRSTAGASGEAAASSFASAVPRWRVGGGD